MLRYAALASHIQTAAQAEAPVRAQALERLQNKGTVFDRRVGKDKGALSPLCFWMGRLDDSPLVAQARCTAPEARDPPCRRERHPTAARGDSDCRC